MNMAEALNLGCACTTLKPELLRAALTRAPELHNLADDLSASRPHLFSASPVFVSGYDAHRIARAVEALHRVAQLPGYRARVLADAAPIAQDDPGAQGAFMGYDFHLGPEGPRLIEINTNAGGALLHAAALTAHRGCCASANPDDPAAAAFAERMDTTVLDMFLQEWRAQRGDAPLVRVAIVDDNPAGQYLAPEFELARALFEANGIEAVVADPTELHFHSGLLWHGERRIDLVYNRLTDFQLAQPAHAALREAYLQRAAVVTPHPHAHALHADKRNLIVLSDTAALAVCAAREDDRALLAGVVPATQAVTAGNADALWEQRRQLFFKPAAGYGGKAAYRGDKLTRKAWELVRGGGFVAQALVPPSERIVALPDGTQAQLRLDVRAYAYRGRVLLLAARTYAGQTTNFRTPGGGFAPVIVLPSLPAASDCCCVPSS
jgi:hypothetical protein